MTTADDRIPTAALALGLGGLIPFIACGAAAGLDFRLPLIGEPVRALLAYSAVILSFLGGARWGLALRLADAGTQARAQAVSVIPSIAAWATLLAPDAIGLAAMPILFLLMGVADWREPPSGAPPWYRRLRLLLTAVVVLTLAGAVAGIVL